MLAQRLVLQRVSKVDAVGAVELAVLVAGVDILIVVYRVALGVRLLDAAARRGVVVGDGKTHHRTVGELDGALDETLTKGATSHDDSAVLILQRTADDF